MATFGPGMQISKGRRRPLLNSRSASWYKFPVVRDNRKLVEPNRRVTPIRLSADMQVMKGGQIQASGLDHLVGWPRSHVASLVVTEGYVLVVCESEAQRSTVVN